MKNALVLVAAVLTLSGSAIAEGRKPFLGKKVTVSLRAVTLASVLELLASISKRNMVLLDAPEKATLDLDVKNVPWDQVLDEVVSQAGFEMTLEGSMVVVGTPARIAERRQRKQQWSGQRLSLNLIDASLSDALGLLSRAGAPGARGSGGAPLRITLRNMPVDQMAAILVELSGGALDTNADAGVAAAPPCPAADVPVADLSLVATLSGSVAPMAVVRAPDGRTFIVEYRGCMGAGHDQAKIIRRDELVTRDGLQLPLGEKARPLPPPAE